MIDVVVDSSAVLAHLFDEAGGAEVSRQLKTAMISSVNLCEVATKLIDRGLAPGEAHAVFTALGCTIMDVDPALGFGAAFLRAQTRSPGLSMGDRVCLALAIRENLPVLTADRAWSSLDLPVAVTLIR